MNSANKKNGTARFLIDYELEVPIPTIIYVMVESCMMGNYHVQFGGQGTQSTDPTLYLNDGHSIPGFVK